MFARGRNILVAVSGGLDSMVLLHILHELSVRHKWKVAVAHFNHRLRGRSSDADEQLVRKTAAALKLPFITERSDVKSFAQKSKLSIEMGARKLRHEFFARAARSQKISLIALAHHADDQVELFFLRLLRGAGGAGLAGMKWHSFSPADKKITLVRPLLDLSKAELCQFAREKTIPFREDATNFLLDAKRNRIRNELLPLLRKNYQPGLNRAVLRMMEITGAESDAIGKLAGDWLRQRRPDFDQLSVALQRRILQSQLVSLGLVAHFELVESLRQSAEVAVSVGAEFSVSRDLAGRLNLLAQPSAVGFDLNELALNFAGRAGKVVFNTACVSWKFDAHKNFSRSPSRKAREFFDADKVGNQITLRHWRPGDYFQPIGLKSAAKLQDIFTNAKISRARRRSLLVAVAADGKIFWVENLRIAEDFKLTGETKRRLVWNWRRP